MKNVCSRLARGAVLAVFLFSRIGILQGDESPETAKQLLLLSQQNEALQQQLHKQQELIEALGQKVSGLQSADDKQRDLKLAAKEQTLKATDDVKAPALDKIHLGGEAGLAFFRSGSKGQFPNSEFRVDEAKLFLESKVWDDVYFFTEINIATREDPNINLRVGEVYVDFENVFRLGNHHPVLNLRVGRLDIPFGEEYQSRDAIDNPLISHSLSDIWGVDEGIEAYGSLGKFQYTLAVQNGGMPSLRDFNSDKAFVGRLGFDAAKRLHLSVSGMRTGDLDVKEDKFSELWFGNGFIRALGRPATTTAFHANLFEGDAQVRLPRGHLKAAGGYVESDDNDRAANNRRGVYYYYIEGLQQVTEKFYATARFSQILARGGFPIVGNADFGDYFFGELTKDLWRLSLGAGYRWSQDLLLKVEYSLEGGETVSGEKRNHQDLLGVEIAVKF